VKPSRVVLSTSGLPNQAFDSCEAVIEQGGVEGAGLGGSQPSTAPSSYRTFWLKENEFGAAFVPLPILTSLPLPDSVSDMGNRNFARLGGLVLGRQLPIPFRQIIEGI
jgi:hypothetical protein